MKQLEDSLRYRFRDPSLLELALTHPSYASEHGTPHNQRLEFLGDAVLEHVVSAYLFRTFSHYDEGRLTRLRASIVSEEPLSAAAEKIGLYAFVRLGAGEAAAGGAHKKSVLSDTMEAVFAAVYLDGGFEDASRVILSVLSEVIANPEERPADYKTALQERLFRNGPVTVEYRLIGVTGPSHNAEFTVEVFCNGQSLGRGTGTSKKRAEQAAAKAALAQRQ